MIAQDRKYKNRYILTETSTNDDLQMIIDQYEKINCIICNGYMAGMYFRNNSGRFITINNNCENGVFWINGMY